MGKPPLSFYKIIRIYCLFWLRYSKNIKIKIPPLSQFPYILKYGTELLKT